MTYIYFILFLLIGGTTGYFIGMLVAKNKIAPPDTQKDQLIIELEKEKSVLTEKISMFLNDLEKINTELKDERNKSEIAGQRLAKAEVEFRNMQEKLSTQKAELEEIQNKFTQEFENIANRLLKQNSKEFTESNQKNMGDILNPLKEKIQTFEKQVGEAFEKEMRDKGNLIKEIQQLHELNKKMTEEANNLTKALKGDSKKQGNWGEVVLERILERSGLTKGREYETQFTVRNEDGDMLRPDVIVRLPEEKHLIIDSKVSLVAYEAYVNAETTEQKEKFLKQHIDSIKNHIKGLSEKNYPNVKTLDSPDFVMLFMPIESSFSVAISAEIELFNFAWDKKIVVVCPTTLLATLRTIAALWRHEKQTQNALEIARQSGALYDKFVGFLADLEKIDKSIDSAKNSYNDALNKLKTGRGNLIDSTEKIKKLGIKTEKHIPEKYLNNEEQTLTDEN